MTTPSKSRCIYILVVLGLAMLSLLSRLHLIQTRPLAGRTDGQEPEGHILITELAFQQTSWRVHHFLPIFTLGPRYNKFMDEHPGAASPDAEGNYYYCSTPPLTFVLPYLASLPGGGPSLAAVRWYNVTLQFASAAALAGLLYLLAARPGTAPQERLLLALTGAMIYLTAPECLKSHTLTLWGQQIYGVLLPAQIYLLLFRPNYILLFLCTAVACLDDWTPYVASAGMAGLALYSYVKSRDRRSLWLALVLLAACAVAGLGMIAWFGTKIPVSSYFANLAVRSQDRAGGVPLAGFLPCYVNSFGLFTGLAVAVLAWRPWQTGLRQTVPRSEAVLPGMDPLVIAMIIYAIALIENLLMRGHALHYSYDRLKGVQLLALFVAWGALTAPARVGLVFRWTAVLGTVSIGLFWFSYDTPHGWSYIAESQQQRLGAVIRQTITPARPAFFSAEIRGAEVYYAGRNVFDCTEKVAAQAQLAPPAWIREWCRQHGYAEANYYEISGSYPFLRPQDMPRTVQVTRISADQTPVSLGAFTLPETWHDYHGNSFYGLDPIWKSSGR